MLSLLVIAMCLSGFFIPRLFCRFNTEKRVDTRSARAVCGWLPPGILMLLGVLIAPAIYGILVTAVIPVIVVGTIWFISTIHISAIGGVMLLMMFMFYCLSSQINSLRK